MSNQIKQLLLSVFAVAALAVSAFSYAGSSVSLLGVQGYDLVSYHAGEPVRGNGNHVAEHDGISYQFSSKANKKAFKKNPEKYLPAYGGFCAYGAALGKKFVGDPEVWKLVDGKLYLNLNSDVQAKWNEDIAGNIVKADEQWKEIKDVNPADL